MIFTEPQIKHSPERILAGKSLEMTFAENKTADLWRAFIPHLASIKNRKNNELVSLQVYPSVDFFRDFNPLQPYTKYALAEIVTNDIPEGLELFTLPAGQYAVFNYRGSSRSGSAFFQHLFGTWLPASSFALDNRPHFEILGEKYKNNQDDSEEEIWIPVKNK